MKKKPEANRSQSQETRLEGLSSNLSSIVVVLFVFAFIFQNFVIPSSSMASTLLAGDHVLVDRETFAPPSSWTPFVHHRDVRRGDVVAFYKPVLESNGEHMTLVKRVIGIPGDHIHLRNGIVVLNGIAQPESEASRPTSSVYDPYVNDFPSIDPSTEPGVTAEWSVQLPSFIQGQDIVVPPGDFFVLGDNRTNSLDSRYWGFVPRANIVGRPLFVYWSIVSPESGADETPLSDQAQSALHEFIHFFDETRWKRTFHPVR